MRDIIKYKNLKSRDNDILIDSPDSVASIFNHYFACMVDTQIIPHLGPLCSSSDKYLNQVRNTGKAFALKEVSEAEVDSALKLFNNEII